MSRAEISQLVPQYLSFLDDNDFNQVINLINKLITAKQAREQKPETQYYQAAYQLGLQGDRTAFNQLLAQSPSKTVQDSAIGGFIDGVLKGPKDLALVKSVVDSQKFYDQGLFMGAAVEGDEPLVKILASYVTNLDAGMALRDLEEYIDNGEQPNDLPHQRVAQFLKELVTRIPEDEEEFFTPPAHERYIDRTS